MTQSIVPIYVFFTIPGFFTIPRRAESTKVESGGISINTVFSMLVCVGDASNKSSLNLVHFSEKPRIKAIYLKIYFSFFSRGKKGSLALVFCLFCAVRPDLFLFFFLSWSDCFMVPNLAFPFKGLEQTFPLGAWHNSLSSKAFSLNISKTWTLLISRCFQGWQPWKHVQTSFLQHFECSF